MNPATGKSLVQTISFTTLALFAFAANSVLCRLALGEQKIDPMSFTFVRLLSGAIVLLLILKLRQTKSTTQNTGAWTASLMLLLYAVCFSFAYVSLDTGTGALILFGTVQITMILVTLIQGNRLHISEWLGMGLAFSGFVVLILPGLNRPSLSGFLLMSLAGVGWGMYTVKGPSAKNPLIQTASNFLRTVPLIALLMLLSFKTASISRDGVMLAALSGSIASGLGYTIWYLALRGLTTTQAAVVQLLVPVIAALGGVVFVSEMITLRLGFSSVMILGGILLVVLGRYYFVESTLSNQ